MPSDEELKLITESEWKAMILNSDTCGSFKNSVAKLIETKKWKEKKGEHLKKLERIFLKYK